MSRLSFAAVITAAFLAIPTAVAAQDTSGPTSFLMQARPARRPILLSALDVSYATLQGYDSYSTLKALKHGAVEANPAMAGVVDNKAAFLTVKAVTTAVSMYAAEPLWRHNHRVVAVAVMVLANGMMVRVAVHNRAVLRRQR